MRAIDLMRHVPYEAITYNSVMQCVPGPGYCRQTKSRLIDESDRPYSAYRTDCTPTSFWDIMALIDTA